MQFTLIHGLNIPGSCAVLFFTAEDLTFTTRHIHNIASFLLWPSHFILFGAIHNCPLLFPSSILDTFWPGVGGGHLLVSYLLAFSYCPWGSPGKNTGLGCHFLHHWTRFCLSSSLWHICLEWLLASLNYAGPFTTTRLWSMKGTYTSTHSIRLFLPWQIFLRSWVHTDISV